MKIITVITFSTLLVALLSCKTYVRIDYDKNFKQERKQVNKMLVLPILYYEYDSNENLVNAENKENELSETVQLAFNDMGKNVIFTDTFKMSKTPQFLNYLVPLQKDIIRSSDLHQDPYMFDGEKKKITRKLFVKTPQIQPEYIALSKEYDTPYVLFTGVVSTQGKSFHYFILTDIEKSEIIYRRLNLLNNKANNSNLYPVIYNSLHEIFNG